MLQLDHEHGSTTTTSTCTFSCVCAPCPPHHPPQHVPHPPSLVLGATHACCVGVNGFRHGAHARPNTNTTPGFTLHGLCCGRRCNDVAQPPHHLFCFVLFVGVFLAGSGRVKKESGWTKACGVGHLVSFVFVFCPPQTQTPHNTTNSSTLCLCCGMLSNVIESQQHFVQVVNTQRTLTFCAVQL